MAIDTAAKRRSAAGVPCLPLGPGVTPDASKPAAWRQQAVWGYSGIAAVGVSSYSAPALSAGQVYHGGFVAGQQWGG